MGRVSHLLIQALLAVSGIGLLVLGLLSLGATAHTLLAEQPKSGKQFSAAVLLIAGISLSCGGGLCLMSLSQERQQMIQIREQAFFDEVLRELINTQQGQFTLDDFVYLANTSPERAKSYLGEQLYAFEASTIAELEGTIVYNFSLT